MPETVHVVSSALTVIVSLITFSIVLIPFWFSVFGIYKNKHKMYYISAGIVLSIYSLLAINDLVNSEDFIYSVAYSVFFTFAYYILWVFEVKLYRKEAVPTSIVFLIKDIFIYVMSFFTSTRKFATSMRLFSFIFIIIPWLIVFIIMKKRFKKNKERVGKTREEFGYDSREYTDINDVIN